jgi:hypothetical protein
LLQLVAPFIPQPDGAVKMGGRLVIPLGDDIQVMTIDSKNETT